MGKSYDLQIEGLEHAVSQTSPDKGHRGLVKRLAGMPGLEGLVLATTRDEGSYLSRRLVVSATGDIVHEDHVAWLKQQVDADGGDFGATRRRLQPMGYQLSECRLSDIYLIQDRGGEQWNFSQIRCRLEHERLNRPLFSDYPLYKDFELKDLNDLVRDAEAGWEYPAERQTQIRPPCYRLVAAFDFAEFMREMDRNDALQREAARRRRFSMSTNGGPAEVVTYDRLDPGWERYPHKARRMFEDWSKSSAGLSGARLCSSWAAQISDGLDNDGVRWMSYIPLWTFERKLAKIDARNGGVYELYGKLEKLDQRLGVPFSWYFYMLHGNRVTDEAGHRVIQAAEEGLIVLPEPDYQVLRRWRDRIYGF